MGSRTSGRSEELPEKEPGVQEESACGLEKAIRHLGGEKPGSCHMMGCGCDWMAGVRRWRPAQIWQARCTGGPATPVDEQPCLLRSAHPWLFRVWGSSPTGSGWLEHPRPSTEPFPQLQPSWTALSRSHPAPPPLPKAQGLPRVWMFLDPD